MKPSTCGILSAFNHLQRFLENASFWVDLLIFIVSLISSWISRQIQKQHKRQQSESDRTEQATIEIKKEII
ncbi:uncharacterized protein MONOS_18227 [Monocercomonoides exilis]|uniref:uncharacterized protein n=1 Tax=Monocercomonoides exilis TaxID=2049356 RepID=UPI00355A8128|nr:hypothetical protein MONOS_18227 [Monocercomonoides exilis]